MRTVKGIINSVIVEKEGLEKVQRIIQNEKPGSDNRIQFLTEAMKLLAKTVVQYTINGKTILKRNLTNIKKQNDKMFSSEECISKQKRNQFQGELRESAPEMFNNTAKELVFKKTVIKQQHLDNLLSQKDKQLKKRKRRTKSTQQSLYISNPKKQNKKANRSTRIIKNRSCNKTKLTLNDNEFSCISSGVDIWGLTRRNKILELGNKISGLETQTLEKGILTTKILPNKKANSKDKSKAHFSLRKIGEAPSRSEWFQQMRRGVKDKKGSNSFMTGFQSNFIKLSGMRNLSINNGKMSGRSRVKKGSLNSIKQKLKLTAESGNQTNKHKSIHPKLNREILTCFQKSPKLKTKKVSEFIINSPQSLNSMTLVSQKIANTSEMKTWVAKLDEKRIHLSKAFQRELKRAHKKHRRIYAEVRKESPDLHVKKKKKKKSQKAVKGLKLNYLWDEKCKNKNALMKVVKTAKGADNNSISFMKMFSTKNRNETNFNKKTTKLWELFKKQKKKKRTQKQKLERSPKILKKPNKNEGEKFFYYDSNFNSLIDETEKGLKRKINKKRKVKRSDKNLKIINTDKDVKKDQKQKYHYSPSKRSKTKNSKSKYSSSRILTVPNENTNPNFGIKKIRKTKVNTPVKARKNS